MLFQPPFPEPSEIELQVVLTTLHFIVLIFLIILMIYSYQKLLSIVVIVPLYLFSLVMAFEYIQHGHSPLSPTFEIFFIIFQTCIFVFSALEMREKGVF